jgi:hypothetical protein
MALGLLCVAHSRMQSELMRLGLKLGAGCISERAVLRRIWPALAHEYQGDELGLGATAIAHVQTDFDGSS